MPWPFKRLGSPLPQQVNETPQHGWLSIHLVRRPRSTIRAMWRINPPMTLAIPAVFTPPPPQIHLQAVNRASTI